jgi:hypothetical protein
MSTLRFYKRDSYISVYCIDKFFFNFCHIDSELKYDCAVSAEAVKLLFYYIFFFFYHKLCIVYLCYEIWYFLSPFCHNNIIWFIKNIKFCFWCNKNRTSSDKNLCNRLYRSTYLIHIKFYSLMCFCNYSSCRYSFICNYMSLKAF